MTFNPWKELAMRPARAWIVTHPDGLIEEVPSYLVSDNEIRWPGTTLPEKRPGQGVEYINADDFYRRHVLQPEGIAVFVHVSRDPNALPASVSDEIRLRAMK